MDDRSPVRAVFFDAGNTLIFPDAKRTLAPLHRRVIAVTREQLHIAERTARRKRDESAAQGASRLGDADYWQLYYATLLREICVSDAELQAELVIEARKSANWDFVAPGTRELLEQLRSRYRLGVISNSDGHIADALGRVGLADCFEVIIDSARVGAEKPNPWIFQAAIDAMARAPSNAPAIKPEEAMYVGDVYSIDYLGAQRAGMQAALLDISGAYRDSGLCRFESLEELTAHLLTPAVEKHPT
jgi:HAD superfamily hydrolase (TIGR01509 family)